MTEALKVLAEVVRQFGPTVTVISALILVNGFFIWRDYKREGRLQKQIDNLHTQHTKVVLPLLVECKEAIRVSQRVIAQNSRILRKLFGRGSR